MREVGGRVRTPSRGVVPVDEGQSLRGERPWRANAQGPDPSVEQLQAELWRRNEDMRRREEDLQKRTRQAREREAELRDRDAQLHGREIRLQGWEAELSGRERRLQGWEAELKSWASELDARGLRMQEPEASRSPDLRPDQALGSLQGAARHAVVDKSPTNLSMALKGMGDLSHGDVPYRW